jgi:hypothetical protein
MARVTGITKERADEIEANSVVGGRVDDTGQLLLRTRGGTEINAGPIISPRAAVDKAYPVGAVYIGVTPTNPATLFGTPAVAPNSEFPNGKPAIPLGTWARIAKGAALVGLNEDDGDFNVAERTVGDKRVTLTANQSGMPYHAHAYSGSTSGSSVNASVTTEDSSSNPAGGVSLDRAGGSAGTRTINDSNHAHSYSGTTGAAAANASESHNNIQPSMAVYVWKRTA